MMNMKTLTKPSSLALLATAGAGYYYWSQKSAADKLLLPEAKATQADKDAQANKEKTAMYVFGGAAVLTVALYAMKK